MIVMNNFSNDSRVLKEGVSASKAGFQVKIVALADDENKLPENDFFDGGEVKRLALVTKKLPKKLGFQLVKYLEYMVRVVKECRNSQIIHCNDLRPLPIAIISKFLSLGKTKILYDAHEFETERHSNINPVLHALVICLESICLKFCDSMITVSEGIALEYQKRYNIKKPQIVMNSPYYQEHVNSNKLREALKIDKTTKIVLYQGGLSPGRGIELILDAFAAINRDDIALVIMGYGPLQSKIEKISESSPNVFFHPAVSPSELLSYTSSADVGILLYPNSCLNHFYCLPNKFFEYTMAGLPVIVSDLYELRRFTDQYKLGIIISNVTAESVAEAVKTIVDSPDLNIYSSNASSMAEQYSWEIQEKKILQIYKELL